MADVTKYIGENGLAALLTLMKNNLVQKVFKTGSSTNYKTLSDNDLTDALKANYDTAYSHSQAAHAPTNAQQNVIESVKVNGTALTIASKAIDVPVPIISTNISSDSGSDAKAASPKAVAAYVANALNGITGVSLQKLSTGQYNATTKVPTVTGEAGVIYLVPSGEDNPDSHIEFIYTDTGFEKIGTTQIDLSGYMLKTDITGYTAPEIQAAWTTAFATA